MTKFSITAYHALDYLLRKFVYMKYLDKQANYKYLLYILYVCSGCVCLTYMKLYNGMKHNYN